MSGHRAIAGRTSFGPIRTDWSRPYNRGNLLLFGADDDPWLANKPLVPELGEFYLYDEYDPRRAILFDPQTGRKWQCDEFSNNGHTCLGTEPDLAPVAYQYFLNHDANDALPRQVNGCVLFAPNGTCLATGLEESDGNDVLFGERAAEVRERTRELLGIKPDQVVVMYAPTFRDYLSADDMTAARVAFFDPHAASTMAAELTASNAAYLRGRTGREPGAGDLYAAHFLGPQGSARLIQAAQTAPGASAAAMFPDAAAANPSIFYRGGQAVSVTDLYANLTRDQDGAVAAPVKAQGLDDGFVQYASARRLDAMRQQEALVDLVLRGPEKPDAPASSRVGGALFNAAIYVFDEARQAGFEKILIETKVKAPSRQ